MTRNHHECPPYCHRCPDLDGMTMPFCWGSVVSGSDEYDLSVCTCDPTEEPAVRWLDLIGNARALLGFLRDARRFRRDLRQEAERLVQLAADMRRRATTSDERCAAWAEVDRIGRSLMGSQPSRPELVETHFADALLDAETRGAPDTSNVSLFRPKARQR